MEGIVMVVSDITRWVSENLSQVQPQTALQWANEAQNLIAMEYPPVASVIFTVTDTVREFSLPLDYLSFKQIRDSEGEVYDTSRLKEPVPGFIRFDESGTFTMYYGKVPEPMSTASAGNDIQLHLILQPLIFDYLYYKYYDTYADADTEESEFATKFYEYFSNKLAYLTQKLMDADLVGLAPDDPVPMRMR